ncbi:MAG: hypothetical protein ABR569_04800 [Gaiellaceae bacterium]
MHFRLPSVAAGVTAFVWAAVMAGYLWLFMVVIGVSGGTALVIALLAFSGIFLLVRLRGGVQRV